MKGFKDFLMQANLVALAVAVIIGGALKELVQELAKVIMGFVGKVFHTPDFSKVTLLGVNIGTFINLLLGFILIAFVVYFAVVKPYTSWQDKEKARRAAAGEPDDPTTEELLTQIRDLLDKRQSAPAVAEVPARYADPAA